jgi:hypothetical protein
MPCQEPLVIKGGFLPLALLLQKRFFSLDWQEKIETNAERI